MSPNGKKKSETTATNNIVSSIKGRYILSSILSYLNEKDGLCTLMTNAQWYRRLLPIFRIHPRTDSITVTNTNISSQSSSRRYRFVVVPVQDSNVLLDRLNTKRLAKRVRWYHNFIITKRHSQQQNKQLKLCCYPFHMTTEQIAWYEWNLSLQPKETQEQQVENNVFCYVWPSPLELLRYRQYFSTSSSSSSLQNQSHIIESSYRLSSLSLTESIPQLLPGVTLLVSYPRSGNTLLRTLLERITNIVTGSDTRPDRTLSKALALQHNLVGEGMVSSMYTPIVKSHFPERKGCLPLTVHRILLLLRNPYDAIDSYWNMCCTNTHTESVQDSIYQIYRDKFQSLVRHEIQTWITFHAYWLQKAFHTQIPMLCIRYEDLILDTVASMDQIVSFLLYDDCDCDCERTHHFTNKDIMATIKTTTTTSQNHPPSLSSSSSSCSPVELPLHPFWKWRIRHGLGLLPPPTEDDLSKTTMTRHPIHVNTSQLGSYQPRTSRETDKDETSLSPSKRSMIGKALGKNHYTKELFETIHYVASNQSMDVLQLLHNVTQTTQGSSLSTTGTATTTTTIDGDSSLMSWLQVFDYDMYTQHFPNNFHTTHHSNASSTFRRLQQVYAYPKYKSANENCPSPKRTIRINTEDEIRPFGDPFGRAMTDWRKSQTCNDSQPFPIKSILET